MLPLPASERHCFLRAGSDPAAPPQQVPISEEAEARQEHHLQGPHHTDSEAGAREPGEGGAMHRLDAGGKSGPTLPSSGRGPGPVPPSHLHRNPENYACQVLLVHLPAFPIIARELEVKCLKVTYCRV